MEEHQPRNAFDIPKVFYFKSGNVHTGSRGILRYRVDPKDGILHINVWREDICFELAKERGIIAGEAEYEVSEEGFQQMLDYLQSEYEKQ
ncbi:MAG: hypothetical protein J6S92_13600 [Oscillospiraceae bacterium]|nr:hypothetical protein [Oscillospiraceae bacterium]